MPLYKGIIMGQASLQTSVIFLFLLIYDEFLFFLTVLW